jgi:hypothetical protein
LIPKSLISQSSPTCTQAEPACCLPTELVSNAIYIPQRGFVYFVLTAGQDATKVFFGLHRHEVLLKPQYARLQIGKIQGQEETIKPLSPGELSQVPYAEPTWLSRGYYSPYYSDGHRKFQEAVRTFCMMVIQPESDRCEQSGKRISQEVVDKMA